MKMKLLLHNMINEGPKKRKPEEYMKDKKVSLKKIKLKIKLKLKF